MLGFKGVRGWVLVAAVCGLAAGASAVKAFQPTGPAVSGGANPLKTLFAYVPVLTPENANCTSACYYTGIVHVLEVPQGQSLVLTDLVSAPTNMDAGGWPDKVPGGIGKIMTNNNWGSVSVCIVVDATPVWCTSAASQYTNGNATLKTGIVAPSGSKVGLWVRGFGTFSMPVLATGYLMRN